MDERWRTSCVPPPRRSAFWAAVWLAGATVGACDRTTSIGTAGNADAAHDATPVGNVHDAGDAAPPGGNADAARDATPVGGDAAGRDATPAVGNDAASSAEILCTSSGGVVATMNCCASQAPFPESCAPGACSCSPTNSQPTTVCQCPTGACFMANVGCVPK